MTNTIAGDCDIGEAQMSVDVTDPGGGQIDFTFHNVGAAASSIADVYWDDGTLLSIFSITNGPGVSFSQGATPPDLPGGNNASPPFVTSVGFSADSDAPVEPNGVNPGEFLTVRFDLIGGQSFANAISDLTDGDLRVGIHVQGFATGGSESFVNTPVPEPGTLALFAGGVLALAGKRRKEADPSRPTRSEA
ncbi:MAG TPA: PEP-CTERM sorting domain-containing protein [Myxococcota bacterium]|nr:PEP-CTERM sorting domain-containing protein [Myxococcota bacterium]